MAGRNTDNSILIIADDFTGANDAGVTLAKCGNIVDVVLHADYQRDGRADVCILNSDSRALPVEQAYDRALSLAASVGERQPYRWRIKKIDSTLRGNPGAETLAMMRALEIDIALVAPAFPAAGRTIRDGQCLVNHRPLTETEFATDPKTPVHSADVGFVFQSQSELPCLHIGLDVLRAGKLSECLAQISAPTLVIIDGETDADLDYVMEAARRLPSSPLLVGSAGLCDAFARVVTSHSRPCLLAVVGSMSEMAQQQIEVLKQQSDARLILINIDDALNDRPESYLTQIANALESGQHCIVHTCSDSAARHRIDDVCRQRQLSRSELGENICAFLGALVRDAASISVPDALYLSGGDVALAAARALGATGFRITGCVAQCVPWGHFLGSNWHMPVMTKAGGFGDETTLLKVLHFIEENVSV